MLVFLAAFSTFVVVYLAIGCLVYLLIGCLVVMGASLLPGMHLPDKRAMPLLVLLWPGIALTLMYGQATRH
jgi:hypothetical protein